MKIIKVDVFDFTIYVANGYKFDKFTQEAEKISKVKSDSFNYNPLAVYHFWRSDFTPEQHKICFLYSEKKLKSNSFRNISAISHEITHIKNLIFGCRGLKSDSGNDEHEACLNEFLMLKILECL